MAADLDVRSNAPVHLENDLHEITHSNHRHDRAKANARVQPAKATPMSEIMPRLHRLITISLTTVLTPGAAQVAAW